MTILCAIDDIPESSARGFEIGEIKIFVVKKHGRLKVYLNSCPHTGANLDWMPDDFLDYDENYIQCSTHGALFQIEDGFCVAGPCSGQSLKPIDFELVDNQIVVAANPL